MWVQLGSSLVGLTLQTTCVCATFKRRFAGMSVDGVHGAGSVNVFAIRELYSLAEPAKLCSTGSVPDCLVLRMAA